MYGDIEIDSDMREYLSLGPGFALASDIKRVELEISFLRGLTIMRWNRTDKDKEDISRTKESEQIDQEEEIEREVFLQERIYKEELNSINMTKLKPTQMDTNRLVMMPGPMSAVEEAQMEVRRTMWMKEADQFIKENCNEDGSPKENNLNERRERGRNKVMDLIKKKKILVMPSDKGKGMVVLTPEIYNKMGEKHTANDKEITEKEF